MSAALRLSNALIRTNIALPTSSSTAGGPLTRAMLIYEMLATESALLRTLFALAQELPPDNIDVLIDTGLPSCLVNIFLAILQLSVDEMQKVLAKMPPMQGNFLANSQINFTN